MNSNIIQISVLCLWLAAAFADPLLIDLPYGRLRGRDNVGYYSYESIPYAQPPLGDLRLEAPKPYAVQWKETFDATVPPVPCIQWSQLIDQPDKLTGSEDCLTVSIYKPKNSTRRTFPVLAQIHGGSFMFGSAVADGHEPVVENSDLMVVKIQYRLGPLGFISTGDTSLPGNLGLKDQRLALRWIQKNIERFGGEPQNVLVLGFSAGAASVHLQLLQEDFNQLAKVSVSISGNAMDPFVVQKSGRQRAFELGRIVGCDLLKDSSELKKCLKKKDSSEIVRAVRKLFVLDYVPFSPFGVAVEPEDADEAFLTKHPVDILRSGKFSKVPWLVSFAQNDGAYNAATLLAKQSNGIELLEELNNRWFELAPYLLFYRDSVKTIEEMDNRSRNLRQQYMGNQNFNVNSYFDMQRMFTDVLFRNGTIQAVDLHRRHGKGATYGYVYDNPPDNGLGYFLAKRTDVRLGTGHSDDYYLIFENPARQPLRSDEQVISKNLIEMLERFVQSDNGKLTYDNCPFLNNVGRNKLSFLSIKSNSCATTELS